MGATIHDGFLCVLHGSLAGLLTSLFIEYCLAQEGEDFALLRRTALICLGGPLVVVLCIAIGFALPVAFELNCSLIKGLLDMLGDEGWLPAAKSSLLVEFVVGCAFGAALIGPVLRNGLALICTFGWLALGNVAAPQDRATLILSFAAVLIAALLTRYALPNNGSWDQ